MQITRHQISRVLDFYHVARRSLIAFRNYCSVGYRTYRSAYGCRVIDAVMRSVFFQNRVEARIGERGRYACEFQRCFEQLLAQRAAVVLPILYLAALLERDGVYLLAAVVEFRSPDATDSDGQRVYELFVVNDRETVARLNAEEIDRPLIDVFEFRRERIRQILLDYRSPQRTLYRRAALLPADVHIAYSCRNRHRVADEGEHDVIRQILFVDEIVEPAHRRIALDECSVVVSGSDLAQRAYVGSQTVEPVYALSVDSVRIENPAPRVAAFDRAFVEFVPLGIDSEHDVASLFRLLCFRCRGGASV